ncbi:hypothetical protein M0R19_04830 [Candidatus Pacearchaeota archaeon]|nr:hypothetical protein [Candidatus Pacearchaeota archaeon]
MANIKSRCQFCGLSSEKPFKRVVRGKQVCNDCNEEIQEFVTWYEGLGEFEKAKVDWCIDGNVNNFIFGE